MFGAHAPPIGSVGQSNYEGMRVRRGGGQPGGSLAVGPLFAAGRNVIYSGGRGEVTIRDGRAEMPIYLAEADGLDFNVIKTI